MSYCYKDIEISFKKVSFSGSDYLYIRQYDRNIKESEERESYIYIELKNFYFKKDGKVLNIGNHLGSVYTLTGYSESDVKKWIDQMTKTISFPH